MYFITYHLQIKLNKKMHYQPKCQHQRRATELCITKGCQVKNCFCCYDCKRIHSKNCEYMQYKKFVHEMHKRQGLRKQQLCRYQERVQNTFNSLIKALRTQFIEFRQQFQRFNATEEINQFYDAIQAKKQKLITGSHANQLLSLQIPKMADYRLRDDIQMKRIQNNIFAVHSYVIKKLRPYYALRQKFQQVDVQFPQINQLKVIQQKYMDHGFTTKNGLLKGDLRYFQTMLEEKVYNIHLLYRASEHNFSSEKFHEKCDGKKNTLIVAKTEFNKLVGLWCPFTWQSPKSWVYLKDVDDAFMFSFEEGLKGMKLTPVKGDFSIGLHRDYGPIFGDDFVIYDKSNNSKSCWSNFPDVYNCRQQPLPHSPQVINTFVGVKDHFQKFNIIQWQVYKINLNRDEQLLDASWMKIYRKI